MRWRGFRESKAGTGTITYYGNGTGARLSSPDTSGRATLYYDAPANPGTTYTLKMRARLISGSGETAPFLTYDYPSIPGAIDTVDYTPEWKEMKLSFTVPYDANPKTDFVSFAVGVFTAQIGEIEITRPNIQVENMPTSLRDVEPGTFYVEDSSLEDLPIENITHGFAINATDKPPGTQSRGFFSQSISYDNLTYLAGVANKVIYYQNRLFTPSANGQQPLWKKEWNSTNGWSDWYQVGVEGGWSNIPLESGVSAASFSNGSPAYRRIGDMVELRGAVDATIGAGFRDTLLGVLPAGFRPEGTAQVSAIKNGASRAQRLEIESNGNINTCFEDAASWASFDGVRFYAGPSA